MELQDLLAIHETNLPYFTNLWLLAEENNRYRVGVNHWTEDETNDIVNQGRIPYTNAFISHKINTIIATQRNNRTSWKVEASSDPTDEAKAELATIRLKDIEQRNNLKYVESDVFEDGVGIKYGVFGIDVIEKDNMPFIEIKKVDYRNFIWDSNSREYDKSDAMFMCEIQKLYRFEIEEEWGKSVQTDGQGGTIWGDNKLDYWIISDPNGNQNLDIISLMKHYQKVRRTIYCALVDGEIIGEYKTKKEADYNVKLKSMEIMAKGGDVPFTDVIKKTKLFIDKYIFTQNEILEYEQTDLEDFPYVVYHAFFLDGNVWSMTDILKSPQKFIDRIISQIDYSFGTDIKNGFEIDIMALADGETYETAVQKLSEGIPVKVQRTGGIQPIKTSGINPQWMAMFDVMKTVIEELPGGRSMQGLSEGANESGKAVLAKRQQGELITSIFLDNLSRSKKQLGQKLLWYLKNYDTAPYILKVHGGAISPELQQVLMAQNVMNISYKDVNTSYIKMNEHPLTIFKDASFELFVSESQLTETMKEKRMSDIALLSQLYPGAIPPEITLEFIDIDYSLKQKIKTTWEQKQQQQAEQQQFMNNQMQQKTNIEKASVLNNIQTEKNS